MQNHFPGNVGYVLHEQEHLGLGPAAALIPAAIDLVSDIFGSDKEDTSAVGFQTYMRTSPPLPAYPPVDVLVSAMAQVAPADQLNSIRSTYNQRDGVLKHGDWYARVDSVTPITLRWFKGSSETGVTRSNTNWSPGPGSNTAQGLTTIEKVALGLGAAVIVGGLIYVATR